MTITSSKEALKEKDRTISYLKPYEQRFYSLQREYSLMHIKLEEAESKISDGQGPTEDQVSSFKEDIAHLQKENSEKERLYSELKTKMGSFENLLNIKNDQIKKLELELSDNLDERQKFEHKKSLLIERIENKLKKIDALVEG